MAKKIEKIQILFLQDYAGIKKGEVIDCSPSDAKALEKEGIARKNIQIPKEVKLAKDLIGPSNEETLKILGESFELIKEIIKEYSDIDDEKIIIISAWIIGTYIHKEFACYPYLFLNAMKGSGKTRLLKIISELSYNGDLTNYISEAVLFRTGADRTLCIDEFEHVGGKESGILREILNSAYKRGANIKRMKKKKTMEGEDYVEESFSIYMPIAMANIWGMDEVLGDRCIKITLEKSSKPHITKLVENFSENEKIWAIKNNLTRIQCSLCSVVTLKNIYKAWNNYIKDKYLGEETTLTTDTSFSYNTTLNYTKYIELFNKIDKSGIDGRNFELTLPLFIICSFLGEDYLEKIINISKKIVIEKNSDEFTENKDVLFIDFISQLDVPNYIKVKEVSSLFKVFVGEEEYYGDDWINSKWVGRSLKRLSLIKDKRRLSSGIEVLLHIEKAKEKIKMFK